MILPGPYLRGLGDRIGGLSRSPPIWLKRLFLGAAVGAMANAAGQLGTFLFGIYIARVLGVANFGLWAVVYSTLLTAVGLSTLSITVGAARFSAALGGDDDVAAAKGLQAVGTISFGLAAIVALGLLIGADILAKHALGLPEAAPLLRLGSCFVLLNSLTSFWFGVVAGREAYRLLLVNNLIGTVILLAVGVPAIQLFGLTGAVAALALSAVTVLWLTRRSGRHQVPSLKGWAAALAQDKPWRTVLELIGPAAISGLWTTLAIWACQAALARSAAGPVEVGLFAAANGLRGIAILALTFFTSAALVILSKEQGRASPAALRHLTKRIQLVTCAVSLAAGIALAVLGPLLLQVYGAHFSAAKPTLWILSLTVFVEAVGTVFYNDLMLRRALVPNLFIGVLPREITRIALTVTFIGYGAIALAGAFLVSALLFTVATWTQSLWLSRRGH